MSLVTQLWAFLDIAIQVLKQMRNPFNLLGQVVIVLFSPVALEGRGARPATIAAVVGNLELLVEHVVIGLLEWVLDVVYL